MFGLFKRIGGMLLRRNFEAAGAGRRWKKTGSMGNQNAAILAAATPTARRAIYYARNNPHAVRAVSSLVSNAIGCGIVPRSTHPLPNVREALRTLWNRWATMSGYYGFQALALRMTIEGGEAFSVMRMEENDRPGLVPLALDLIDREQVPFDHALDLAGASRVRAGIELDHRNRRVAYHILPARLDEPFYAITGYRPVRVQADDVLHLFQPLTAGQLRGISWLAPVLTRLSELDQFEDASLVKAKTQSLFVGFLTDVDGDQSSPAYAPDEELVMEPGAMLRLPIGADVKFSDPAEFKEYDPFVRGHLRAIAAGIGPGILYEFLSQDLAGVTYSSIRQGLIEFRRGVEQLQELTIIPAICEPVWRRFVTTAVLTGLLDAPDFEANPEAYFAVEWQPPAWPWVDPESDVNAELKAIQGGLKSRAQAVAQRGYDIEEIDRQNAADTARQPAPQETIPNA